MSLAAEATLYVISPSRGYEVAAGVLGEDYDGVIGRDGWKPYDGFQEAIHQLCLAHIFGRIDRVLDLATRAAVVFPRALKRLLRDALDLRDRRDRGELGPHGLLVAIGRPESRLDRLLSAEFSSDENRKLAATVEPYAGDLFTFLRDPEVEATNWPAEQAIRPAVVNRKLSGGNRTERGAKAQAVLASVFRTSWQRDLDPIGLFGDLQRSRHPAEFATTALGP